jgi:FAD/FMN-containing dehydrogenase
MKHEPAQFEAALLAFRTLLGPKGYVDDPSELAPWLSDWRGLYQGHSAAILSPASTAEVCAVVGLAHAHGIPLVPQGGNTSMVGGATPPADGHALILSLRRMITIRSIVPKSGVAVVEAGVILSVLHDAANQASMRFPLSLGAKGSATIGGLVSTNAGGTQVLRFGTMRNLVLGVEAVLPDGSLFNGLLPLKKDNRGYDLNHLLIGAEGTLGVITAATLKLVPAITDRAVGWVGVDGPHAALALLRWLEARSGDAVESFELVPDTSLKLVLHHIPGARRPLDSEQAWHVLVDYVAPSGANAGLETLLAEALEAGLARDAVIAANETQADAFWRIRDSISEAERAATPLISHDISVTVDRMPDFMADAAAQIERAFPDAIVAAYGHLGDGNVHFHVRAKTADNAAVWRAETGAPASRMVYDLVTAAGGSISAEHGIGQMKLAELVRQSDPVRLNVLRAIKKALDPAAIMNPGKLVPLAPEPSAP